MPPLPSRPTTSTWGSTSTGTIGSAHRPTAVPQWQDTNAQGRAVAEPWFTYTDGQGQPHEVWYADGASVTARLGLVRQYGLGGVAIWRLGGVDPANWSAIAAVLHPTSQVYLPIVDRR